MSHCIHVHPVEDTVEHDIATDDCVCGPLVFPYRDDADSPVLEMIVHHPLSCDSEREWIAEDTY